MTCARCFRDMILIRPLRPHGRYGRPGDPNSRWCNASVTLSVTPSRPRRDWLSNTSVTLLRLLHQVTPLRVRARALRILFTVTSVTVKEKQSERAGFRAIWAVTLPVTPLLRL
jgi:hypothetical protein